MNEERFSHHEPCPRCGSRDNLGVWDDGHKWCFGCRLYIPADESLDLLKRKTTMEKNNKSALDSFIPSGNYVSALPAATTAWLSKYGITPAEINHYGICWNPNTESLAFPLKRGGQIVFVNERYFGKDPHHPKYKSYGHKAHRIFIDNPNTPNSLVLVEDFVSAVKVARFASCLPLFGSSFDAEGFKWASERFKHLRLWLDMDKALESVQQASKLSQWIPDTRTIITELDPKEYSNNELIKILKEYKVLMVS